VLWCVKGDTRPPGNKVTMMKVAIGAYLKIPATVKLLICIMINGRRMTAYSSSSLPKLEPPKQAGHSWRRIRVHSARLSTKFIALSFSLPVLTWWREDGIDSTSRGKACCSIWSEALRALSTLSATSTRRLSNHWDV
jgi:hypothetical protein